MSRRRFGGLTRNAGEDCAAAIPPGTAALRIAECWRCNRLAICKAELVGHKETGSRSSSRSNGHGDLSYGGPVPDARLDLWGTILAIALAASEGSDPEQLSMRVTVTPEQAFPATIKAVSVG